MSLTVIVPTFDEAPNIAPLVERIAAATRGEEVRVLFVDDSRDDTPQVIEQVAATAPIPVRVIHRDAPTGGLSGAVVEGLQEVDTDFVIVMDGDLQHPPEVIPSLLEKLRTTRADVVVASRYTAGGTSAGLSNVLRHLVSTTSGALTKAMFPIRLRNVTDPMTGFFAIRTSSLDLSDLRPRGFKILLEILAREPLVATEVPFEFGRRLAGDSKASVVQGLRFVAQLAALRFGRLARFAAVGAIGTVLNLLILAALVAMEVNYIVAAVIAAAVTILSNFFLQEHFAFRDLRHEGKTFRRRFLESVGFNALEAAVRTPFLYLIVEFTPIPPVLSQAITLGVAFLIRFLFQSRVVYRPRRIEPPSVGRPPRKANSRRAPREQSPLP
jgi:dolichol-phosphate mannosyltransferase